MGRNRGTGFVIFPAMRLFQTDGGWGWGGKRGVLEFPTPSQTKQGQSSDATKLQFTSLAGRVSRSGTALVRFRPVTQKEGGWVGGLCRSTRFSTSIARDILNALRRYLVLVAGPGLVWSPSPFVHLVIIIFRWGANLALSTHKSMCFPIMPSTPPTCLSSVFLPCPPFLSAPGSRSTKAQGSWGVGLVFLLHLLFICFFNRLRASI